MKYNALNEYFCVPLGEAYKSYGIKCIKLGLSRHMEQKKNRKKKQEEDAQ